jgi:ketosteroid isomerase-like protein
MNDNLHIHRLAESVFHAMNARDFTDYESMITDDVAFDFPGAGRAQGSRRTLLLMKSLLRKFPELKFNISEVITETDRACVVWTNEGKDIHGKPYVNAGITLQHFRDGKISFISDYFKDTSFAHTNN